MNKNRIFQGKKCVIVYTPVYSHNYDKVDMDVDGNDWELG
jgi:hypothetical protein